MIGSLQSNSVDVTGLRSSSTALSVAELERARTDFPILSHPTRSGHRLAYLDWAATSQKPLQVLQAEERFYFQQNGGVNRGTHYLADAATEAFEGARIAVASFLGAAPEELLWTKNATEAINLVSYALSNLNIGRTGIAASPWSLNRGDEIVVTQAEHHSNLVPWQELCARTGATLRWLTLEESGRIDLNSLDVITERTRLVAFTHASNVTGAITTVAPIVARAREFGALTLLDACQSAAHFSIDFQQLGVDFLACSGHKMLGPTGVGALLVRKEILQWLPPFLTGGSMVDTVTMESTSYKSGFARFEAGTQMVAQAVGWQRAVEYLRSLGMDRLAATEADLTAYTLDQLREVPGLQLLGPTEPAERLGVFSFTIRGVHPHDAGQFLDSQGVAIRVGHHCAQPIHAHFGVRSSGRLSLGPVTLPREIDAFVTAACQIQEFFGVRDE